MLLYDAATSPISKAMPPFFFSKSVLEPMQQPHRLHVHITHLLVLPPILFTLRITQITHTKEHYVSLILDEITPALDGCNNRDSWDTITTRASYWPLLLVSSPTLRVV